MAVFLDIQGAFDNVPTTAIIKCLKDRGMPETFIKWYSHLLESRVATIDHMGVKAARSLTVGTPQGGVLSPPMWNVVFDTFLALFRKGKVKVVGFADDAGLVAKGEYPSHLSIYMQEAVNKALSWGRSTGLQFSAPKTVSMLFTHKRKFDPPPPIWMDGTRIRLVDTARYLGVILDSKLSWKAHLKQKVREAKGKLMATKAAMGKLWGIPPNSMRWVYLGIVRPSLLYGSLVWSKICDTAWARKELTRLNRLALLTMGHFRKGTPTAGLEMIAHVPPLDLTVKFEATMGYRRTLAHCKVDRALLRTTHTSKIGHRQICRGFLGELGVQEEETDDMQARLIWKKSFSIDESSFQVGLPPTRCVDIDVYTDGSLLHRSAGAGVAIYVDGVEKFTQSTNLGAFTSVFQAELYAIRTAASTIMERWPSYRIIRFYVDSQAAIRALDTTLVTSRMVMSCIEALNKASVKNVLSIKWIKAHAGHLGNERADVLAKEGTNAGTMVAVDGPARPGTYLKSRLKARFEELWKGVWNRRTDCRQTKQWLTTPSKKTSYSLLKLGRRQFSKMVQLITGHNFMNRHQAVLGLTDDPICRLCLEEEETSLHVVAECPALARTRLEIFGAHVLDLPLQWSDRMATFLREGSIGHLLDWDEDGRDLGDYHGQRPRPDLQEGD
jgi:ribonuclease HI